jgi:hypothetical protein
VYPHGAPSPEVRMVGRSLGDQQLVIHAFVALDGDRAAEDYDALSRIWGRCRDLLGVEAPITDLPSSLPMSLHDVISSERPEEVLAALEERDQYRQMIVRRVQNVINFSMVFTDKKDAAVRRRIGAASPPGWVEFDRWWDEMAEGDATAFLGVVRLYLATTSLTTTETSGTVRVSVPNASQGRFWWERGQIRDEFMLWEWTPEGEARPERRIVAVGRSELVSPASGGALSDWAWSTGHPSLPPLARYLLHASRLRSAVRDWDDGATLDALLDEASQYIDAIGEPSDDASAWLVSELDALAASSQQVRSRREDIERIVMDMAASLRQPLRSDQAMAGRLAAALREAEEELEAAQRAVDRAGQSLAASRAGDPAVQSSDDNSTNTSSGFLDKTEHLRPIANGHRATQASHFPAPHPHREPGTAAEPKPPPATNGDGGPDSRVLIRMGFGVDVVGYSQRSHPAMEEVQRRLQSMIHDVLAELGVQLADTDHQSQGDSMKVFLPSTVEVHKALPQLLHGWLEQLDRDNRRYDDRIRMRMSAGVGPIGVAALGFAGDTPVEIARLLDSDLIRQAVIDHPDSDLVVLVSDKLHEWAIVAWRPGAMVPAEFQRVRVVAKGLNEDAWLWIAAPATITPP